MSNLRKLLIIPIAVLCFILLNSINVLASKGLSGNTDWSAVPSKTEIIATSHQGGTSAVIQVSSNGKIHTTTSYTQQKTTGGGTSEPPCFVWSHGGTGYDLATTTLFNQASQEYLQGLQFNGWDISESAISLDDMKEQYSSIYEKLESGELTLEDAESLIKFENFGVGKEIEGVESLGYDYELTWNTGHGPSYVGTYRYKVTDVHGTTQFTEYFLRYMSGDDSARADLDKMDLYYIIPNPELVNNPDYFGPGSKCGLYVPGEFQAFVTGIPTIPVTTEGKEGRYSEWVVDLAVNSKMQVELEQIDENTYKANVTFGENATTVSGNAILPKHIEKVTYLWGLRVPSEDEPLTKTVKPSTRGMSVKSQSEIEQSLRYPYEFSGTSSVVNSGSMAAALGSAFSTYGGSLNGGTYIKDTSHLFQDSTRKYLEGVTNTSFAGLNGVDIIHIDSKSAAGRNFFISEGSSFIPQYSSFSDVLTSTLTIPANWEGNYIVTVSVIVHGKYVIPEHENGQGFSFTYPLGFASDAKQQLSSSCAELQSKFLAYAGVDYPDSTVEDILENEQCEIIEWVAPKAIANYNILNSRGEVELDGSQSTGTYKHTHTYRFEANTKTVSCGEDCEKVVYDGTANRVTAADVKTQYFPIVNYTWSKKYRVFMPDGDGLTGKEYNYELDLSKGKISSASSTTRALMHKGATFACLTIKTSAPKYNSAGGGPNPLAINDRSGNPALTHIFDSYDKALYFDAVKSYPSCVFIDTNEEDYRIHENVYHN